MKGRPLRTKHLWNATAAKSRLSIQICKHQISKLLKASSRKTGHVSRLHEPRLFVHIKCEDIHAAQRCKSSIKAIRPAVPFMFKQSTQIVLSSNSFDTGGSGARLQMWCLPHVVSMQTTHVNSAFRWHPVKKHVVISSRLYSACSLCARTEDATSCLPTCRRQNVLAPRHRLPFSLLCLDFSSAV